MKKKETNRLFKKKIIKKTPLISIYHPYIYLIHTNLIYSKKIVKIIIHPLSHSNLCSALYY